jgi:hypothetical protein
MVHVIVGEQLDDNEAGILAAVILVLSILQTRFASKQAEWLLIATKARTFLIKRIAKLPMTFPLPILSASLPQLINAFASSS